MKEKTFEELIEENTSWSKATLGGYEKTISTKKCLKLLQQVREAMKWEVSQIAMEDFGVNSSHDFIKYIEKLPVDRIKLKD